MAGPRPAKAENKPEEQVEIVSSEPKTATPATEIEVDVTTGKPVETTASAPSVSAEDFRKLQARYEYQARQFEKSQKEMSEQLAQLRNFKVQAPVIQTERPDDLYGLDKEYLNQLGQNDWTQPVKLMAEKIAEKIAGEKVKSILEEREKQQAEHFKQQTTLQRLEKSKAKVLDKYPSLTDESSEDFRVYYQTYNEMMKEDPDLISNPRAPELVMFEMEAQSASRPKNPVANAEAERLKRVAAGIVPQGRTTSSSKTIRLTQDELDFCKEKGISPAVYASMKDANFKEGVTA